MLSKLRRLAAISAAAGVLSLTGVSVASAAPGAQPNDTWTGPAVVAAASPNGITWGTQPNDTWTGP